MIEVLHKLTFDEHRLRFANFNAPQFCAPWLQDLATPPGLLDRLKPRKRGAFVAIENGDYVGHALWSRSPKRVHQARCYWLNDLSIAPDHRRQGWGRRLVQRLELFARDRGIHDIATGVWPGNAASEALFRSQSYLSWPKMDDYAVEVLQDNTKHFVKHLSF